jgi:hypothetical protein
MPKSDHLFYQLRFESDGWHIYSMAIDPTSSLVAYPTRLHAILSMRAMREFLELAIYLVNTEGGE